MGGHLYVTINDMIRWFGGREMCEIASADTGAVITEARLLAPDDDPEAMFAAGRVTDALTQASRLADSYLARRYPLPLDDAMVADSPMARHCGEIARFLLWDDRASESVRDRHDRAIRWLEMIASGKASLTGAAPSTRTTTGVDLPMFTTSAGEFGTQALRGF